MSLSRSVRIIEGIAPKKNGQDARLLGEFLTMAGWDFVISKTYRKSKTNRRLFLNALFKTSDRFLHISCHGDENGLSLEDPENTTIGVKDVKDYLKKRGLGAEPLAHRFITLSACGHVSGSFVKQLHNVTKVTAVISPLAPVEFSESALFSTMFYFSLAQAPKLSVLSRRRSDSTEVKTAGRLAQYIDAYQKTKIAYLELGGTGAHRLDYWWENEHIILN